MSDEIETIDKNPKSWAAWKREAERLQAIIDDMALAEMDSESGYLPLDYLQGHKDGLEWAARLAEANHPDTGDWLYDDPIELAKAIRKGPDMPPAQPVVESEPVALQPELAKVIYHFRDWNEGFPVERFKADYVISWMLANYPQAQPAPVVGYVTLGDSTYDIPYSMPSNLRELIAEEIGILFSDDDAQSVWNVCRSAAMLNGGKS